MWCIASSRHSWPKGLPRSGGNTRVALEQLHADSSIVGDNSGESFLSLWTSAASSQPRFVSMTRLDSLHPDLRQALYDSGWHPQRRVDTTSWLATLTREGYEPNSAAEDILIMLGGLVVEPISHSGPNFSNDEPLSFDPISAGVGQRALALDIEAALGGRYFPIGEWLSYSSVFIEASGRVVAAGLGWVWGMGSTFEEALELAICANRPLVCLHSDPGLDPWPR